MDGHTHRMLLVDDDIETRTVMRRMLALCLRGWEIEEAGTLAEGLARLRPPPDCLLLDLDLPDGAGEALLRRVRDEDLPTHVVVSTGNGDATRLGEVSCLAPDAFVPKPLDATGLTTICGLATSG